MCYDKHIGDGVGTAVLALIERRLAVYTEERGRAIPHVDDEMDWVCGSAPSTTMFAVRQFGISSSGIQ
jgi:hypothetical protein